MTYWEKFELLSVAKNNKLDVEVVTVDSTKYRGEVVVLSQDMATIQSDFTDDWHAITLAEITHLDFV
jgi:hypothetical protein